ncbi:MAG: PTS fructose transporter subunit IIA [Pseudomonadota bacterium]
MIGIVIVTHGHLADEFIAALEHVTGAQTHIASVCIQPDDNMDDMRAVISEKTSQVDTGAGVVIMTDMFGGTPSNLSLSVTQDKNIEVLAGINLPALVKLATIRHNMDLVGAVNCARDAG